MNQRIDLLDHFPNPDPGGLPGRLQRTLPKSIGIRKNPRNERKDRDPEAQVQIARRDDHHQSTRNIDVGVIAVEFKEPCKELLIKERIQ